MMCAREVVSAFFAVSLFFFCSAQPDPDAAIVACFRLNAPVKLNCHHTTRVEAGMRDKPIRTRIPYAKHPHPNRKTWKKAKRSC